MGKVIKIRDVRKHFGANTATMTSGVFDLFHEGHLRYLEAVSKRGRPFVVIIQSDKRARSNKGKRRPIISEKDRARIIAALSIVDYAIISDRQSFHKDTIKAVQPKKVIFYQENMKFKKARADKLKEIFPNLETEFIYRKEMGRKSSSTTRTIRKIQQLKPE